jgi:hypothetical protein
MRGNVFSRSRLIYAFAAVFCVGGVLAGCGGSSIPTAASPTTVALPHGYAAFTDRSDRFSIAVPAQWRQIDPSSPGASQSIAAAVQNNPGLKNLVGSNAAALVAQGMRFIAVDYNNPTGATVNVVARAAPGARDSDLPQLVGVLKTQYAKAGLIVLRTASVPIAGHTAIQVTLDLRLNGANGQPTTKREVQDIIAANDLIYILTFAGSSPAFSTIGSTFKVT